MIGGERIITANELKTGGVSRIDDAIDKDGEAIISVRGERRYVVMSMERYNYLRECELEAALAETRRDIDAGRVIEESVEEHVRRVTGGSSSLL